MRFHTPRPFGAPPLTQGGLPQVGFRGWAWNRVLDLPPFAPGAIRIPRQIQEHQMGKGDRKTAKGKRYNASYGNARAKATTKAAGTAAAPVKKTATKTAATKAPAKKAVVKKAAAKE